MICSLFFSNVIYGVVGPKKGLVMSMVLYAVYVLLFAFATTQCAVRDKKSGKCTEAHDLMWAFALGGAAIGGLGAGLLWTCQGAFYAVVCDKMAIAENRPKAEVTADFAGVFGMIFLGFECIVRALTSVLRGAATEKIMFSNLVTFLIWAAAAAASAVIFAAFATDLKPATSAARGGVMDKLLVAVRLWRDPKLWLLQTTNITFGFAVAWLGGYVAPNVLSVTLGAKFIGFAGAMLSGLAAILALVFGPIAARIGKGPILAAGCVAFASLAILSKLASHYDPGGKYLASDWGDAVVLFYVMMGIGRAVYESTNKAIIADVFPGDKAPAAFANVFVFGTAASTVAFALSAFSITAPFYWLLIGFAAATLPAFFLAMALKKGEDSRMVASSS